MSAFLLLVFQDGSETKTSGLLDTLCKEMQNLW